MWKKLKQSCLGCVTPSATGDEQVEASRQEAQAEAPVSSQNPPNSPIKQAFPNDLKDPTDKISSFLSNEDLIHFSYVNTQARAWTLFERERRALDPLLLAVVQGNQAQAERLLQSHPRCLLSTKAKAEDYSGRLISEMTPFQAALCAGDVEMCKMMRPYFDKLENGQAELEQQFHEIFANGLENYKTEQEKSAFDFSGILKAITDANANEVTQALDKNFDADTALNKALATFRQDFDKKSKSEKIFNPYHLLKAFQCYKGAFDALGGPDKDWDKCNLLWRQVVGYTQRYLPACYAQAFAQGVYYIVETNEKPKRSFDFSWGGGGSIFPLVAGSGLGFNFCCGRCARRLSGAPEVDHAAEWIWSEAGCFKIYIEQKHQAWQDYFRPTHQHQSPAAWPERGNLNFARTHPLN